MGWHDATLRLRVTALPVAGAANVAVRRLLARALGVPSASITVVRGLQGRTKIVEVAGLAAGEMRSRLALILAGAS